ncbi:glycine betaine/L-proline ABC transporter, permease and substrate-binding protein [gamma proteobacterium NOR5-3]|nr:glycine betaine/L-proline ABC transporter, permease and substrate-binding protein [gamma proteobacterium NOR5-3]
MTPLMRSVLLLSLLSALPALAQPPVVIGSKTFSESHVLGEIAAQYLEAHGQSVERRMGLGGTLISYEALVQGELDIYPEYTGTLTGAVFNEPAMNAAGLTAALAKDGLEFYLRLGFDNSYAMAMSEDLARSLGIAQISDLGEHPDLEVGLSHEFLNRGDGWPELQRRYGLPQQPSGIEHALAYRALDAGQLDVADAYTTDGDLDLYGLRLLDDDLAFFPTYDAGYLIRQDLPSSVRKLLSDLEGFIDEPTMRALNRRVANDGLSPALVAFEFLREQGLVRNAPEPAGSESRIAYNTAVHLKLTAIAVGLGCLVAIPLALLVSRSSRVAGALQYLASLFQTIPALALLALLIPILGLGQTTAIFALFLYSLLPIVRNTLAGLAGVDPLLKEVARSLGLTPTQQILRIELPLATPMIIAGIKTAAIISIGTATLAAFVGAGGLGEPIITGLSLNNHRLILEGAIPAACLAIATELAFGLLERRFIPAHLRVG